MASLMANVQFAPVNVAAPCQQQQQPESVYDIVRRAQQDPLGFEEMVKRVNPEGYQRAVQIKNCANPKAMVMEMARAQGVDPNILHMLGLN